MAEGARLESVYVERHQEFESLAHRHHLRKDVQGRLFLCLKFHKINELCSIASILNDYVQEKSVVQKSMANLSSN